MRSPEITLGRVIGRIDDKGVILPVANGVTQPLPDALPNMRAPIQRDDASVVDGLHENRDVVAGLEDLEVAVVRRLDPWRPECDAALGQASVFRTVSAALRPVHLRAGPLFLRLGRQRRKPSIRRVGNQRRSVVEISVSDPELVVVAGRGIAGGELLRARHDGVENIVTEGGITIAGEQVGSLRL